MDKQDEKPIVVPSLIPNDEESMATTLSIPSENIEGLPENQEASSQFPEFPDITICIRGGASSDSSKVYRQIHGKLSQIPGATSQNQQALAHGSKPGSQIPGPSLKNPQTESNRVSKSSRNTSSIRLRSEASNCKTLQSTIGKFCILDMDSDSFPPINQDIQEEETTTSLDDFDGAMEFFREQAKKSNFELTYDLGVAVDENGKPSKPYIYLKKTNFVDTEEDGESYQGQTEPPTPPPQVQDNIIDEVVTVELPKTADGSTQVTYNEF